MSEDVARFVSRTDAEGLLMKRPEPRIVVTIAFDTWNDLHATLFTNPEYVNDPKVLERVGGGSGPNDPAWLDFGEYLILRGDFSLHGED